MVKHVKCGEKGKHYKEQRWDLSERENDEWEGGVGGDR